ncbi:unnamed protein product [Owenia fusiformis]|uniref:Calcineurin-like phosphoesterase domain-containing protein n=1 Tax=Owenia fusiformis TaxID=6347 RepID=A0A8J1TSI1_OWEFU|nr:unnamed protein product [Owenia fusiformis]
MSRIYTISDVHVDYLENRKYIEHLSDQKYESDVLLLAGDVTDNLSLLKTTLQTLKKKFKDVFYVPGNHELWLKKDDREMRFKDSIEKFHAIIKLCHDTGVKTEPEKVTSTQGDVWVVPLFAWYSTPYDDPQDSLYAGDSADVHQDSENMWMDNHLCLWTSLKDKTRSQYFADLNKEPISLVMKNKSPGDVVVSFSHFLSRKELLGHTEAEFEEFNKERSLRKLPEFQIDKSKSKQMQFDFSLFAGCKVLEEAIRMLGSVVHVHGHQHRNRDREIGGVRYVSHCLGYPREQQNGFTWGLMEWDGPKQIWPSTK